MGGGDDRGQDELNQKLQAQIDQQNSDLEEKRKNIFDERFRILKAQGAENWTPDNAAPIKPTSPTL